MLIDHIEWAVGGLDDATLAFCARTGLGWAPGGTHPGWGTENRIVPLGQGYLEFITVVEPEVAATVGIGRSVVDRIAEGGGLVGWGVTVDDLDSVAARLGLTVTHGHRRRTDGRDLRWRMAGLEEAFARALPFFMSWDDGEDPSKAAAQHEITPAGFAWIEVGNEPGEMEEWLGPHELDIRYAESGRPGPIRAAIATEADAIVFPPIDET